MSFVAQLMRLGIACKITLNCILDTWVLKQVHILSLKLQFDMGMVDLINTQQYPLSLKHYSTASPDLYKKELGFGCFTFNWSRERHNIIGAAK
jgi:hypothetical protein